MAQDELTAIPGLQDKHRKVLAEQLHVTTLQGLVLARRPAIHEAMRRLRPRPSMEAITEWQDHARDALADRPPARSDWDRSATFVVSFEERRGDRGVERQLAVEQAEVEPEQPPEFWSGWDCQRICRWMQDRLPVGNVEPGSPEVEAVDTADVETSRPRARIDRATFMGARGGVDVVTGDVVASTAAVRCPPGGRLRVTVSGPDPDAELDLTIRLRRPGARERLRREPVVLHGGGQAEFDLSDIPAGTYDVALLAWAPGGSVDPRVVEVPKVAFAAADQPA